MPDHTWESRLDEGQRTLEQACRKTGIDRWPALGFIAGFFPPRRR